MVSTIETERRGLPWLFLTTWSSSENYTRHLYDVDFDQEKKISRKIKLPSEMNLHDIIGSSEGYLLTIDYFTQEIHAMNPLTGSYLLLPSTASLPNMIGILRNSISADTITHYVIQYDKHDDHNKQPKIEQYLYQGKGSNSFLFQSIDPTSTMAVKKMRQKDYYGKAILSPSLDAAVVIHGLYPEGQLAFVRIGLQTPPPSSWTPLHNSNSSSATRFIDIIFHRGRLHALDNLGTLTIFDLDNPSSPPLFRSPAGNPVKDEEEKELGEGYLVESPNGDDLFVVYRDIQEYGDVDDTSSPRTNSFKIYKLDKMSTSDNCSK